MSRLGGVTVQSVTRALDILECFNGSIEELGISELSEMMGLSKSTIYGLVNTLLIKGYLEQNNNNKRYHLGLKLFELGSIVNKRMDLRTEAKPFCEELSKKNNATVHLAARYNNEIVYIDKVDTPTAIIIFSQVGKRAPLYCTGVGKAILAFLEKEQINEYISSAKFIKYTERTITSGEFLLDELNRIEENGYAIDNEEIVDGLKCIAAPIFDYTNNPIGAISVSFPLGQLSEEDIPVVSKDVIDCAQNISKRLGYSK